jgi:HTH-type transcriptional regulator/antitoxin HigA
MKIQIIRTASDYKRALVRIKALADLEVDPAMGTPVGDEFNALAMLIETYEDIHHPTEYCSPVEIIKFYMDQKDLRQQDLVPYIGSRSRVSEVLNGKRELTIGMIRNLHAGLGIPLGCLINTEDTTDLELGLKRARAAGDRDAVRALSSEIQRIERSKKYVAAN